MRFVTGFREYNNRKSRRYKHLIPKGDANYYWRLAKPYHEVVDVFPHDMPSDDIGNGLTNEYVLTILNQESNCFDFEYAPKNNDILQIERQSTNDVRKEFLYFVYWQGAWVKQLPTGLSIEIASGKIIL